jgi:hypothetical protein
MATIDHKAQLAAWYAGTTNGGPNGDGRYPLTDSAGVEHLVLCPAADQSQDLMNQNNFLQLIQDAQAAAELSNSYAIAASSSENAAATSASNAADSASSATSAKTAAETAKTAAETAKVEADSSKAAAAASATDAGNAATAAAGSATAASNSASVAATSASNAAASASSLDVSSLVKKSGDTITGTLVFNTLAHAIDVQPGGARLLIRSDSGQSGGNVSIDAVKNDNSAFDVLRFRGTDMVFSGETVWRSGNFDPASKVNKSGDTLTGSLAIFPSTGEAQVNLSAPSGRSGRLTANSTNFGLYDVANSRWSVRVDGGNVVDMPGGATFGSAIVVNNNSLRLSGWGGSGPNDGVLYMGAEDSYIYKQGSQFLFKNAGGGYTTTLNVGGAIWTSANFDPNSKANTNSPSFTGTVSLPTYNGTNFLIAGAGDNATYALQNIRMHLHWGLGLEAYDNVVRGVYDARTGTWDTLGGYKVNGQAVWHAGNFNPANYYVAGSTTLELGTAETGDRNTFIDFHAANGVDNNARIIRWSGTNGSLDIQNQGTGVINIAGGGNLLRDGNTVWHAGNFDPASKASLSNPGEFTGRITVNSWNTAAVASASSGGVEIRASGSGGTAGAAVMAFHRPGNFAGYFGLDTDNAWRIGGWSYGAVSYRLLHEGLTSVVLNGSNATPNNLETFAYRSTGVYGGGYSMRDNAGSGNQFGGMWMNGGAMYFGISAANANNPTKTVSIAPSGLVTIRGGGGNNDLRIESISPTITCFDSDHNTTHWIHCNDGNHGFLANNSFSWACFRNAGNDWQCQNNIIAYASDRRLKHNIHDVPMQRVDHVFDNLRIAEFDWNPEALEKYQVGIKPKKREIGAIAQEVQAVYPDAVAVNETHNPVGAGPKPNILTIMWEKLVPLIFAKVKQHEARIRELEERILKLESLL